MNSVVECEKSFRQDYAAEFRNDGGMMNVTEAEPSIFRPLFSGMAVIGKITISGQWPVQLLCYISVVKFSVEILYKHSELNLQTCFTSLG